MKVSTHPVLPERVVAPLLYKREVAPEHFRFTFEAETIARQACAGHFLHILPRHTESQDPFLRRAFSIVSSTEQTVDVLFRVTGRGTAAMSRWEVGEKIDFIGPLGKPFEPLGDYSILVGGGVGTPPMAMLASEKNLNDSQKVIALIGARNGNEVLCEEDFAQYGVPVQIATDDGSRGHRGFVTHLLKENLEVAQSLGQSPLVYACGPIGMLRSVAEMCALYQVPCQVSLEENMPCGVGVCNGCVVPVLGQNNDFDSYRRICVDGPVIWSHEVQWGHWTSNL